MWRQRARCLFSLALGATLSVGLLACALPAAGPTSEQLERPYEGPNFTLVRLDERVIGILQRYRGLVLGPRFRGEQHVASNLLRPGDVVAITVYETGLPLFGAAPVLPGGPAPGPPGTNTS